MAKILIVDDSASMRQMVTHTLSEAGHQVTEAVDGEDALAKAKAGGFSAVITDVNMPKMDGITLVGQLREQPALKGVPILLLTTESAPEKKQEGKRAGATGWLVKPFDPEQLLNTLSKVLG